MMGSVSFVGTPAQFGSAVNLAGNFDVFLVVAFDAGRKVVPAEFGGGVVAVFLEGVDLGGQAAEKGEETGIFIGGSGELVPVFGINEEAGDLGGGELEADLGQLGGVGNAEVLGEIVLEQAGIEGTIVFLAPFFIAATGFPVGNIAPGDLEAMFIQGTDDFVVGDIVAEHAIDHVAFEVGEPGNFAISGFGAGSALWCRCGVGSGRGGRRAILHRDMRGEDFEWDGVNGRGNGLRVHTMQGVL